MGVKTRIERRKEPRFQDENKILINALGTSGFPAGKKVQCALTRDLSPGGVRILSDRLFPEDTDLDVELKLSNIRRSIKTKGKVRWAKRYENSDLFEIGVEFYDTPAEDRLELLEYSYRKKRPE
jgi:c-di-GMP-binding flagellar brake protein YcgR